MQILKLVQGDEALDVQPVGQQHVRIAPEQVPALRGGQSADGREHVCAVSGGALDVRLRFEAESPGLAGRIDVRQMLVVSRIVNGQMATELSGVGGEDGGHACAAPAQRLDRRTAHPLVKVRHDPMTIRLTLSKHLQVLLHQRSERQNVVQQRIAVRQVHVMLLSNLVLDRSEPIVGGFRIEQDDGGPTDHQPATVMRFDAVLAQRGNGLAERASQTRRFKLDLRRGRVRPEQAIPSAPALDHARQLRADNGVDAAELLTDLPCHLHQQRVAVARSRCWVC